MGSRLCSSNDDWGFAIYSFNFSTYCKSTFLNSLRSSDVLKSSTISKELDRFSEEDIVMGQEAPETIEQTGTANALTYDIGRVATDTMHGAIQGKITSEQGRPGICTHSIIRGFLKVYLH